VAGETAVDRQHLAMRGWIIVVAAKVAPARDDAGGSYFDVHRNTLDTDIANRYF
jgi:hypothetical protein